MLRCRGALLPPPVVGRQHRTLFAASPVALKPKHTRVVELDKLPEVESRHYGSLSLPAAARRRSAPAPTPTPTPTPTPPPAAAAEAATRAAAKAPSAPPQQPPPEQRPRQQEAAVEADTPVPSTATAAIHPDRVAVAIHPDRVAAAAQRRPRPRADESHLLVVKQESLLSRHFPDLPEGLSPDHVLLLMDMRRTWISMKGSSHARDLYPFPLEELLAHMSGGDGVEPSAVFSVMLDVVTAGPETVELVEEMRSRGAFYRELLPRPWRPGMPERYGQRRSRHAVAVMHDSTVSQLEDIVAGGRPAKLYRIFFFNALYAVILKVRGMAYALHEREESSVLAWTVECDHLLVRLLARNLPREARDIMLGYTDDPYDVRIQKTLNAETWNALLQGMATKSKYAIVDYDNDRWDASIEKVAKLVRSRNILLNHVSVSYLVERWHDVDRHKAVIAIATRATSRDANGARVVFSGETWAHVIKSLALATTPQAGMDLGEALKARVLQEYEGRYAAPDDFLARAGSRYVDARLPLFPELKRGWLHHALLPLKFQTHLFHTLMEVATLLPDTGVAMAKLLSLANEFKFRAVPQMEALQVLEARARSEDAVPMLPPSDDEPPEAAVEPEQPSEEDATAAAVGGDKERNEAYHGYFRYMSITSVQHPWTVYFKDVTLAGCIVTLCLSHNTENGAALVFKLLRDGFTLSAKTITLVATRVEKHCRKLKFQERKPDKAELLAKAMLLELTTAVSEMTRRYATRWGDAKDGRAKRVRGAFMTPHVLDAMKTAQRDLDRALFRLSLSTQDFSSCLTAFSKYAEDATNPNLRIRWIEAGDLLRMLTVCADHGRWKTAEALFAQYTSYSAPHRGLDTEQSRVRDTETSTSWYLMVNQLLRAHAKTPISASELRFERFMELSLQACLRGSVLDFAIVKESLRLLADKATAGGGGDPLVAVQNRDPRIPLGIRPHKLWPRAVSGAGLCFLVNGAPLGSERGPSRRTDSPMRVNARKLPVSTLSVELLLLAFGKRRRVSSTLLHQAVRVWLATDDPQAIPLNLVPLMKRSTTLQVKFIDAVLRCCDRAGHIACRRVVEEAGEIKTKEDVVALTAALEAAADALPEGAELEGRPAGDRERGRSKIFGKPCAKVQGILELARGPEVLKAPPQASPVLEEDGPEDQISPNDSPARQPAYTTRNHRYESPIHGLRPGE